MSTSGIPSVREYVGTCVCLHLTVCLRVSALSQQADSGVTCVCSPALGIKTQQASELSTPLLSPMPAVSQTYVPLPLSTLLMSGHAWAC